MFLLACGLPSQIPLIIYRFKITYIYAKPYSPNCSHLVTFKTTIYKCKVLLESFRSVLTSSQTMLVKSSYPVAMSFRPTIGEHCGFPGN